MRGERALDVAFDSMGCLRLNTEKALVMHMGNRIPETGRVDTLAPKNKSILRRLLWLPVVRKFLLWLNNQIFHLYFINVE
jgi:hypothetical protein